MKNIAFFTIGKLYALVIFIITCWLSTVICKIEPNESYTWYSGIWHGLFVVQHWIMSWFSDGVLLKAPIRTSGYTFWWWTVVIIICLGLLSGTSTKKSF
jgi:hypothetical protein